MRELVPPYRGFLYSRLWETIAGLPLILFNALAAAGFAVLIGKANLQSVTFESALRVVSDAGSCLFFSLEAVLVCIRRLPLRKLDGIMPRLVALLAAYSPLVLILLPHRILSMPASLMSSSILVIGIVGHIVTLAFLGRSFAILPQARCLITSGPYRYTRHPLYFFGQLSLIGVSLQFAQPWALMIVFACFLLQFPRMRYEERVLLQTFSDYKSYQERTALLIPRLI